MAESSVVKILKDGVRTAATHRLFGPGHPVPVVLPAPNELPDLDDCWLVKIVVNSKPMNIYFRVYYTVELAKTFYHNKHAAVTKEHPARLYHDFIREFCNLTAGAIKVWLSDTNHVNKQGELIVNLPDQKPAQVELPAFGKADSDSVLHDVWQFTVGNHSIVCSSQITIIDQTLVRDILPNTMNEQTSDSGGDEIEFF
jgi:hypothetical protein